ncbi:hypothetical protein MOO46_06080 [Apilactobacillus apisilvae]|uniref:Uncharacterized protein n=1 Tax=Apilactobacillus apisilvae TaxID=2923364 RepID=A0ABY4PH72_9LACO|nr:hypothetical protein [Apilactobacillus apisilvae]UQS84811.1 hypothetical protein MOO46_06080 [Apilactobacillus apisilvae]
MKILLTILLGLFLCITIFYFIFLIKKQEFNYIFDIVTGFLLTVMFFIVGFSIAAAFDVNGFLHPFILSFISITIANIIIWIRERLFLRHFAWMLVGLICAAGFIYMFVLGIYPIISKG